MMPHASSSDPRCVDGRLGVGTRFVGWAAAAPVLVALLVTAAQPAAGEPPVAPGPESVAIAPEILPASLAQEASPPVHGPRSGAVPLGATEQPASASPSAVPRPLPDWRLLAALGAAFAAVAAYRFVAGRSGQTLPPDVFELLGEASLGGQQSVRVVRFGPRTLLVGVSSAGCQTLAEIADAQATDSIVSACRGTRLRGAAGGSFVGSSGALARGRSRSVGRQAAEHPA
jgi:hypothetical protein